MSMTFCIRGEQRQVELTCFCHDGHDVMTGETCEYCHGSCKRKERVEINMANQNGCDLLRWLGIPAVEYGQERVSEVKAKCQRRLWPEARNEDPALPTVVTDEPGRVYVVECGRRDGYLREKTQELFDMIKDAGPDELLEWS